MFCLDVIILHDIVYGYTHTSFQNLDQDGCSSAHVFLTDDDDNAFAYDLLSLAGEGCLRIHVGEWHEGQRLEGWQGELQGI